jgi:hypothetical protein
MAATTQRLPEKLTWQCRSSSQSSSHCITCSELLQPPHSNDWIQLAQLAPASHHNVFCCRLCYSCQQ